MREAFFLGTGELRRFCLVHRPSGVTRGALLHVHPFAEELNRSRPMCAIAAQAFADAGWLVLQVDGAGCGDSFGEFGNATWTQWLDDLDLARAWLFEQGHDSAIVWTLRGGSLLAADWMRRAALDWPLLMWQPMTSGKQLLTQFLRLSLVDDSGPESKHVMAQLRQRLAQGDSVDVGGYVINARLAAELEASALVPQSSGAAPMALLEVSGQPGAGLTPAAEALLSRWQSAGRHAEGGVAVGPKFWQSYDTRTAPDLVPRSLQLLEALA